MSERPSDGIDAAKDAAKPTAHAGASQLLVELGPVVLFVLSYNVLRSARPMDAIFIATGIFIVATLAALAWSLIRTRRAPPVLIVTGVLVVAFGGLTLLLHDENFMKVKPTFVNFFYGAAIFGSLLARQNLWKLLFGRMLTLPDRVWTVLAVRWGAFFIFMGLVNEAIRLTQSTEVWVNSRIVVVYPLILGFALLNAPLIMKHAAKTDPEP